MTCVLGTGESSCFEQKRTSFQHVFLCHLLGEPKIEWADGWDELFDVCAINCMIV